ncbi:hypothetical protein LINGRAPRIM_LOCUS1510 [Linum grandiflorum]
MGLTAGWSVVRAAARRLGPTSFAVGTVTTARTRVGRRASRSISSARVLHRLLTRMTRRR